MQNYEKYKLSYCKNTGKDTTDDKRVGPEKDFLSWIQKKLTIFSMDDGEQKRMEKEHRYAVKTTNLILNAIVGDWKIISFYSEDPHVDFKSVLFQSANKHFDYDNSRLTMWKFFNSRRIHYRSVKLGEEVISQNSKMVSFVEDGKLVTAFIDSYDKTVYKRTECYVLNEMLYVETQKYARKCTRIYEKIGMEKEKSEVKKFVNEKEETFKPQPVLTQMPWNIKQKIADHTDMKSKFKLRQCSTEFYELAGKSKMKIHKAEIILHRCWMNIFMQLEKEDKNAAIYASFARIRPGFMLCSKDEYWQEHHVMGSFIGTAAHSLMSLVREKQVYLEEFVVEMDGCATERERRRLAKCLDHYLGSMGHLLKTEKFRIMTVDETDESAISGILRHLDPEYLREIHFQCFPYFSDSVPLSLQNFVEMPQFKNAKALDVEFVINIPYNNLKHFAHFKGKINHLSVQTVKEVVENGLTSGNIKSVIIEYGSLDEEEIVKFCAERKQIYQAALEQELANQETEAQQVRFNWGLNDGKFSFAEE